MSSAPFTVTVHVHHTEQVIPPRCRKPRPQKAVTDVTFDVTQVTSDQAPVVLQIPVRDVVADEVVWNDVRGYEGALYVPQSDDGRWEFRDYPRAATVAAGSKEYPAEITTQDHQWADLEFHTKMRTEWFGRDLIIDGMVWRRIDEPAYQITYWGFAPHISLDTAGSSHPEFPLTDLDEALADLRRRGGDKAVQNESESHIVKYPVRVLDASYIRVPHRADVLKARKSEAQFLVDQAVALLGKTSVPLADRAQQAERLLHDAKAILNRD